MISSKMEDCIKRRENMLEKYTKKIKIIEDEELEGSYTYAPILSEGDAVGLVIMFSEKEQLEEKEEQLIKIVANFLGKHLEQ